MPVVTKYQGLVLAQLVAGIDAIKMESDPTANGGKKRDIKYDSKNGLDALSASDKIRAAEKTKKVELEKKKVELKEELKKKEELEKEVEQKKEEVRELDGVLKMQAKYDSKYKAELGKTHMVIHTRWKQFIILITKVAKHSNTKMHLSSLCEPLSA